MLKVGDKAPNLKVSEWVQGEPTNIDKELGKVVLVEAFQVNCPGAIFYGMKNAEEVYQKFSRDEVTVLGLATAFEDYALNNLANLKSLLYRGDVVGDTKENLQKWGGLRDGRLKQKISFPIATDSMVVPPEGSIYRRLNGDKEETYGETFHGYDMMGTPTTLLIDKNGTLRTRMFGSGYKPMKDVKKLLKE